MELTEKQYTEIKPSLDRYRLSVDHRVKVFNDTDKMKALELKNNLGITEKLPNCQDCDFLETAHGYFRTLNNLAKEYEKTINTSNP